MTEVKYKQIFIKNEFVNSESGKTFPTINPNTGEKITDVQEGDKADIDKAVAAARAAFALNAPWRLMDPTERARILRKWADLIESDIKTLSHLATLDNGKSSKYAMWDLMGALDHIRYHSGWCDKIVGETLPSKPDSFVYTRREPIGVCGIILPWNFPELILCMKIAPALACGCTIVVKPAEQTPLTALHLAALAKEAGFPPGVINIVPGYGPTAGAALASHMDVNKIAFTGSTQVGHLIMEMAAKSNLKRVSLELGGKSPLIILPDADLDHAALVASFGIMFNNGQACVAASRTFVHESVYDKFAEKSVALAKAREQTAGDPFAMSTEHTALIDDTQFSHALELIESGKKEGATLLCGGGRMGEKGFYVQPTVFGDVKDSMRIAQEEIFGPVQSLIKFSTIEEAVERANRTQYGLAAGVFTNDINKAILIANSLEAGTVWVNNYMSAGPTTPFGGFKQSGFGKDCGQPSIDEFTEIKTVNIQLHGPLVPKPSSN